MKKLLIPSTLLVALALTIVIACNKEGREIASIKKDETSAANNSQMQRLSSNAVSAKYTTNSTYGFLVFADTAAHNGFLKSLIGNTHQEIRDYQTAEGFTSLGTTYYSSVAGTDTITQDQAPLYSLNSSGVVQIQGVVFKQMNQNNVQTSWDYFLTMLPKSLNASSYSYLAGGTFVSSYMNKFADGEVLSKGLFKFIQDSPKGHQATGTVNNSAGKFWGTTFGQFEFVDCPAGSDPQCTCIDQPYDTYIFWIHTGHCTIHYTCSGNQTECD